MTDQQGGTSDSDAEQINQGVDDFLCAHFGIPEGGDIAAGMDRFRTAFKDQMARLRAPSLADACAEAIPISIEQHRPLRLCLIKPGDL